MNNDAFWAVMVLAIGIALGQVISNRLFGVRTASSPSPNPTPALVSSGDPVRDFLDRY